jgi:NAD(P)-dependent dehydrogenase (short-subunit alcohol dehydrogenase family)
VSERRTLAAAVGKAFGKLDVLFVNAGMGDFRPVEQWDEAGFDRSVSVNLKGSFFPVQALLPILSNPSSIVLNTSINARIGQAIPEWRYSRRAVTEPSATGAASQR